VLGRLKACAGFGQLAALRAVLRSLDPPCARWRLGGCFFKEALNAQGLSGCY
jgi:hypothetical protein